jgi:putative PEP-CTERM system TPR-repeat lipoprotein
LLCACMSQSPKDSLESAKVRLAANDRAGAIIELKNALQADASSAEARFLLGKTLFELDDITGAQVELTKAFEGQFDAERVVPLLAQSRFELGMASAVLKDFDVESLRTPKARAQLLAVHALAQASLNNLDAARKLNESALRTDPENLRARLNSATLAFNAGQHDQALGTLDQILASEPGNAKALAFKGQTLEFGKRDSEGAALVYEQLLKIDPKSVGAYGSLVQRALRVRDFERAKSLLEPMQKHLPNHPHLRFLKAAIALAEGKPETAREQVPYLLRSDSPPAVYLQMAGMVAYRLNGFTEAEKFLTRALLGDSQNRTSRLLLAQVHMHRGEAEKALEVLDPLLKTSPPIADAWAAAGQAFFSLDQLSKAESAYNKAIQADPDDVRAKAQLAVTEIEKGSAESGLAELARLTAADRSHYADLALISAHVRRKEFAEALKAIELLQRKPGAPQTQALVMRGTVELALGRRDEARKSFEQVLELDRTHYVASASLATLDLAEKRNNEAVQRIERLLSVDPGNLQAELSLIGIRQAAGLSSGDAVGALRDLVKRHPAVPQPRLALIDQLRRNGDAQGALVAAQDAAAAQPQSLQLLEALGMAQLHTKDFNQAKTTISRFASLSPKSAQPMLRMAELQLAQSDSASAIASLQRALSIQPDHLPAALLLATTLVESGKAAELRKLGSEVQKAHPNSGLGHLLEGEAEALQKNWSAAARAYRAGLAIAPANAELGIKYVRAARQAGLRGEADRYERERMQRTSSDSIFIGSMADDALQSGQLDRALDLYRKVLDQFPDNAAAANNAAWILHHKKMPGALELAERAVKNAPDAALYLDTLASVLADGGQMERALATQRKAVAMAPKAHVLRLQLAKLLIKADDKSGARVELERLAALGTAFKLQGDVKAMLAKLN